MIPLLVARRLPKGGDEMSDIQFLAIKEFEGKLVTNNGSLAVDTIGNLAILQAGGGKDMYLGKAKITMQTSSLNENAACTIVLKVNDVVKETSRIFNAGSSTVTARSVVTHDYEFELTGLKVTTGQIIKVEATQNVNAVMAGVLECFEEATGTTPQIASI